MSLEDFLNGGSYNGKPARKPSKKARETKPLLDEIPRQEAMAGWESWRPQEPPSLRRVQHVFADTEGTSLKWWEPEARTVGWSVYTDELGGQYLPHGHRGGGNLDKAQMVRWACSEDGFRGKDVYFLNARYDSQMLRKDGVDLEALGCRIHDVGHMAALEDETRKRYSLQSLAIDKLGAGKDDLIGDKTWMALRPAGEVQGYAVKDAKLLRDLKAYYDPIMRAQGLLDVLALEDELIWCVCEMERNAAPVDEDLLAQWEREVIAEAAALSERLRNLVGFAVNPDRAADMIRMVERFGVRASAWEQGVDDDGNSTGSPTFADDALERAQNDEEFPAGLREAIAVARDLRRVKSLHSKFIGKYRKSLGEDGLLRFSLHQLGEDDYGTVTGRFSASAPFGGRGFNPQQVFKPSRQKRVRAIAKWLVRRLFRPAPGKVWLAADAAQIEIRLAAHYAALMGMPRMAQLYARDPHADMHNFVMEFVKLNRDDTKNYSFMKLYGGGVPRAMEMTGRTEAQCRAELAQYDANFPEFKVLMDTCSERAKTKGHVHTVLGRRRRYPEAKRLHSALNAVIQGTAGDVMKRKLVEVYKARHELGLTLRFTVHDEVDADAPKDPSVPQRLYHILNEQSFKFEVPILWEVSTGPNWCDLEQVKEEKHAA